MEIPSKRMEASARSLCVIPSSTNGVQRPVAHSHSLPALFHLPQTMKPSIYCIIFFSIFHIAYSFKCSNLEDCSNNGYCNQAGQCMCYGGYFDKDCSQSLLDENQTGVIVVQVVYSVIFGILTAISSYAFYRSVAHNQSGQAMATNIRAFVFAIYTIELFTQFLYVATDPFVVWKTVPYVVLVLFNTFNYPLGIIALLGILFHWIDLINTSVETLKKEEMMQKINKFYKGKDITLEDMVEKVQFLRKLRIPFVITGICIFVLLMTVNIMQGANYKPEIAATISGPVILACYAILCVGFLYYGRKLSKLIPYQLTKKVQRLTTRLTAYCLLVFLVVGTLIGVLQAVPRGKSPSYSLASFVVVEACCAALVFGAISIFFTWQKKFPFINFSGSTKSSSGQHTSTQTGGNTEDIEMVEDDVEMPFVPCCCVCVLIFDAHSRRCIATSEITGFDDAVRNVKNAYPRVTDEEANEMVKLMYTRMQHLEKSGRIKEWDTPVKKNLKACEQIEIPPPTDNIRELKPGHVSIVGSMGDSITAAFAASSSSLIGVKEWRGQSWSIGGDEGEGTFPNTLVDFVGNLGLYGPSLGTGDRENPYDYLNGAVSGAIVQDMPAQAVWVVERLRSLGQDAFQNQWKVITIWIGGNNLCDVCNDLEGNSPDVYEQFLDQALHILSQVPKTFVNVVPSLDVTELSRFSAGFCRLLHPFECRCATSSEENQAIVKNTNNEYTQRIKKLSENWNAKNSTDFAVVVQPFLIETQIPDETYLSAADCFHPSKKSHQAVAVALWNSMIVPASKKALEWYPGEPIACPTNATKFWVD